MATWKYKISLRVLKNISLVCFAHSSNIFQHSHLRNFVSSSGHAISSIPLISCYPCSDKWSLQEGRLLNRGVHSVSSCVQKVRSDMNLACRKTPSLFSFLFTSFYAVPTIWTPGTGLVSFWQFYHLGLRQPPTVKKGWPVNTLSPSIHIQFSTLFAIHFLKYLVERIKKKIRALSFSLVILITFSLDGVSMLLGENWFWSLLAQRINRMLYFMRFRMHHLHISHNAPYLPPLPPQKKKICTSSCNTQEKWKTKVMQNLGEQIRCIMGDVQVAYCHLWQYKTYWG